MLTRLAIVPVVFLVTFVLSGVGCSGESDPIMNSMAPGSSCLNPGSMTCGVDNTGFSSVLLCSPQGIWVVYEVCDTGTVCTVTTDLPKCVSNSPIEDVVEPRDASGFDFGQNLDGGGFTNDWGGIYDGGPYDFGQWPDGYIDAPEYDHGAEVIVYPDYGADPIFPPDQGVEVIVDVIHPDVNPVDIAPNDYGPRDNGPVEPFCGDAVCDSDEGCSSCPADCACSWDLVCYENECCQPACDDRQCGDDGCGGVCGYCDWGMACNETYGVCESTCNFPSGLPSTFGPMGVINSAMIPTNSTLAGQTCTDFTGDGVGDSGLTGLAGQINGSLQDAVQGGDVALLLEMVVAGEALTGFEVNGLFGVPQYAGTVGGNYEVDPYSYNTDTCTPHMRMTNAQIVSNYLESGPTLARIRFNMFMRDETLPEMYLPVYDAGVFGHVDRYGSTGVAISDGVFSGVVLEEDLETILDQLDEWCATAPPGSTSDVCSYLPVARTAMGLLLNLHRLDDGSYIVKSKDYPGNASSLCFAISTVEAKATGYSNPGDGVGSCSCSQGPGSARAMPMPSLMASILLGFFLIVMTRVTLRRKVNR